MENDKFLFIDKKNDEYTFELNQAFGQGSFNIYNIYIWRYSRGRGTLSFVRLVKSDGKIIWALPEDYYISKEAQEYISQFMIKDFKMKAFW